MNALEYVQLAVREAVGLVELADGEQLEAMTEEISAAEAVFVAAAGRSLLMIKAFAMRLMHLGIPVHVVGDVTTPAIREKDLLIFASASGETATLLAVRQKAGKAGTRVAVMTARPQSSLAEGAATILVVPGATDKAAGGFASRQPAGSSFEQSLLLLCDGMVMRLAEKRGLDPSAGYGRHANLE